MKRVPVVISFINLKGGVAKTTTTVQLADTLAFMRNKRVLVIDLDPQTNATLALIGESRWEAVDDAQQTLAHLFLDLLHGTQHFDLARAVVKGASNLNRVPNELIEQLSDQLQYGRIDLLPSSIKLIDVQDRMQELSARTHYTVNPMEVLKRHVSPCFEHYDYVLIDCPPNLGFVTQNGLEISDFYVIPTIPDRLSTYGIPQIARHIAEIRRARQLKLRCLGVLVTKFQSTSTQHKQGILRLPSQIAEAFSDAGEPIMPIFDTIIPQTNASAEAMNFEREVKSYREKYGVSQVGGRAAYRYGLELADEIELLVAQASQG